MGSFPRCFNDILGFLMKAVTEKVTSPNLEGGSAVARVRGLWAPREPMQQLPGLGTRIKRDKEKGPHRGQRRLRPELRHQTAVCGKKNPSGEETQSSWEGPGEVRPHMPLRTGVRETFSSVCVGVITNIWLLTLSTAPVLPLSPLTWLLIWLLITFCSVFFCPQQVQGLNAQKLSSKSVN